MKTILTLAGMKGSFSLKLKDNISSIEPEFKCSMRGNYRMQHYTEGRTHKKVTHISCAGDHWRFFQEMEVSDPNKKVGVAFYTNAFGWYKIHDLQGNLIQEGPAIIPNGNELEELDESQIISEPIL